MNDISELKEFTNDEARQFVINGLEGTSLELNDFIDILVKPIAPRALRGICRTRYDELCKGKAQG